MLFLIVLSLGASYCLGIGEISCLCPAPSIAVILTVEVNYFASISWASVADS